MTAIGFKNQWEMNVFTKEGELKYSATFPNVVTNIGIRWLLINAYSDNTTQFVNFQQIQLFESYVEPDPEFGRNHLIYTNAYNNAGYTEGGQTNIVPPDEDKIGLYGFEFLQYTGDNNWLPELATTTPSVTAKVTLTIDPYVETTIYNFIMVGEFAFNLEPRYYGVFSSTITFSISALPDPYFWSNEEIMEITYTVSLENA